MQLLCIWLIEGDEVDFFLLLMDEQQLWKLVCLLLLIFWEIGFFGCSNISVNMVQFKMYILICYRWPLKNFAAFFEIKGTELNVSMYLLPRHILLLIFGLITEESKVHYLRITSVQSEYSNWNFWKFSTLIETFFKVQYLKYP